MPALKGESENAFSGKQKDRVLKETSCSFRHGSDRGKTAQGSPPAPKSQTQNDGRRPSKGSASRGRNPPEREVKERARITSKESVRIRRVITGILPVCQNYKKESGCKFGGTCLFRHAEDDSQPSKKVEEKWWKKGSEALMKKSTHLGCVFQNTEPPNFKSILRKSFDSEEARWSTQNLGKRVHRKELFRSANFKSAVLVLQNSTKEETLQQERCARREAWDLATNVHKLNNGVWSLLAPSSKKPEER